MDKDVPEVQSGAGGEARTPCPVGFPLCYLMKNRKQSAQLSVSRDGSLLPLS